MTDYVQHWSQLITKLLYYFLFDCANMNTPIF